MTSTTPPSFSRDSPLLLPPNSTHHHHHQSQAQQSVNVSVHGLQPSSHATQSRPKQCSVPPATDLTSSSSSSVSTSPSHAIAMNSRRGEEGEGMWKDRVEYENRLNSSRRKGKGDVNNNNNNNRSTTMGGSSRSDSHTLSKRFEIPSTCQSVNPAKTFSTFLYDRIDHHPSQLGGKQSHFRFRNGYEFAVEGDEGEEEEEEEEGGTTKAAYASQPVSIMLGMGLGVITGVQVKRDEEMEKMVSKVSDYACAILAKAPDRTLKSVVLANQIRDNLGKVGFFTVMNDE